MDTTTFFVIIFFAVIILGYLIITFVSNSTDDFMKIIWLKTLWLWLPIHALFRLSREIRDKKKDA
jgi:hypothetical protein